MNPLLQSVQLALQNATQKEALVFIDKVVDFCIEKENAKVLEGWDRDTVRLLVSYNMAKGTFLCTESEDAEITGVLMWYNCNYDDKWDFLEGWYPDDKNGDTIFLAFMWSSNTKDFKKLIMNLIVTEPTVLSKKLTSLRTKKKQPTKIDYSTKVFAKILTLKDQEYIMGSKGKVETPYTRETGPGDFINQYMFGGGSTGPRTMGVTDPTLQGRILGAEALYRPQYTGLELSGLRDQLYGLQPGRVNPEIEMLKAEIAKYSKLERESQRLAESTKGSARTQHIQDRVEAERALNKAKRKLSKAPKTLDTAIPGMFELGRAAAEEAGITQRSEEDLQRAADVGALQEYAPQVVEAYREADPYSTGLAEKQTAMADDLYQRSQGLNAEQQRIVDQQALQMAQSQGRVTDQSAIAGQLLGRENYLAGLRSEAAGMGQQAFGMNRLMSGDQGMAILGRPTQSAAGGSALMGSTQGLRTGPALFDPNAGVNYGMQNQANMMQLQGAQAQAGASKSAGTMGMIGSIGGSVLGGPIGGVIGKGIGKVFDKIF